jgi:hypothetical protein
MKQNVGVGFLTKCAKVSGQKAALAKIVMVKATQSKSAPGATTMPEASFASTSVASAVASVSKLSVTITSPRARVL